MVKLKLGLLSLMLLVIANSIQAQAISFEEGLPKNIQFKKGEINLSGLHRVSGNYGLHWKFTPDDELRINTKIGYAPQSVDTIVTVNDVDYPITNEPAVFTLPIYSEKKQDAIVRVSFGRGEEIDCFIDIHLAYKGWRKFTIPYARGHMRGNPHENMDFMKLSILGNQEGEIFIDDIVLLKRESPKGIKPTHLVPGLKLHPQRRALGDEIEQEWHLYQPWFALQDRVTPEQQQSFKTIEERLWQLEWGGEKTKESLPTKDFEDFKKRYADYNITRNGEAINGLHLEVGGKRSKFNQLGKAIAIAYRTISNTSQKEVLKDMALNMIAHGIDCDVNLDWYHGRGFADMCFLMKDELKAIGKLEEANAFIRRKYEFNRFYNEDVNKGRHNVIGMSSDALYTNSIGYLMCVMLLDGPEKVRDMQHLVSYYSNLGLGYANGLTDSFKPDGSHYHHANAALTRYGSYTMPKVAEVIYILSGTEFRIYEAAHERMKHNLYMRNFYSSRNYFPWSYSHNRIKSLTPGDNYEFLYMALAGTPDGKQDIDKEIAEMYFYQMEGREMPELAASLLDKNIETATFPQGHHTLSYHAKGIHRKDDWMTVIGAHSRYIFQKEIWGWHSSRGNMKYGMFENWGSLEIIYPDKPGLKQIDNGRGLKGWDWTMTPGVTSVNAPLKNIENKPLKLGDDAYQEHLRSDQAFVGGLDFSDGNGVFVAKIRGHDKYKLESFYATKSWFSFGDLIVCLGSDIQNDLPEYTTHTSIFQNDLSQTDFNLKIDKTKALKPSPFNKQYDETSHWMLDSRNVGYYIPSGQKLNVWYGENTSPDYQGKAMTTGTYEKAWLSHGKAPDGEAYEYAVKVKTSKETMKVFAKNQDEQQEYKVLVKNNTAHVVKHPASNTTAAIVFEPQYQLKLGKFKGVSHSGIYMLKEENNKITLAVSDPDLRFYEGHSNDVDLALNRKELPGYSNYWHAANSIPSKIKVFLEGDWDIDTIVKGNGTVIQQANGVTVIEFVCKDGLTNELILKIKK